MRKIKLRAPGKINWTLDVKGKRPDGYHEVEMLMQSIGLWDEITLTEKKGSIGISGNSSDMPLDEGNLAVRAAKLVKQSCGVDAGVDIKIHKEIPVSAGLAGGSTDAAAVLVGLNALWGLGLTEESLAELGGKLGADVPFCIRGGTAVARGIGDKLTPLPPLEGIWLVLVKPPFGVSTASVYGVLSPDRISVHPDWEKTYHRLRSADFTFLPQDMANVLEPVTTTRYPEIHTIRQALRKAGAAAGLMTGSGPTVFGVFRERRGAREASEKMKKLCSGVYLAETLGKGAEIIEGGSHDSNECDCAGR